MGRLSLLAICLLAIMGCARVQSQVLPNNDFFHYKTAYLVVPPEDEFNLAPAITWELTDMGLHVVGAPLPPDPLDTDMLVKFTYVAGWDFQRYLRGFNVHFIAARDKTIIASTSYFKLGLFVTQATRMEDAFNDLRSRLNLPPTKQFQ